MKFIDTNACIECEGAEVITRKFIPNAYIQDASLGKLMKYKCDHNSEAKIVKVLSVSKKVKSSHIKLGDLLEAEQIIVCIGSFRAPTIKIVKHTGRHNAQKANTSAYTFAQISRKFQNIPTKAHEDPFKLLLPIN
jgi:hypothetical protein